MKKYYKIMFIGIIAIIGLLTSAICSIWLQAPAVVTACLAVLLLVVIWFLDDLEVPEKEVP